MVDEQQELAAIAELFKYIRKVRHTLQIKPAQVRVPKFNAGSSQSGLQNKDPYKSATAKAVLAAATGNLTIDSKQQQQQTKSGKKKGKPTITIKPPSITTFFNAAATNATKADKIIVATNDPSDSIPSHIRWRNYEWRKLILFLSDEAGVAGWEILCIRGK